MHTNIYSIFMYDFQHLEAAKMFFNKSMDQQILADPYRGLLFIIKIQ